MKKTILFFVFILSAISPLPAAEMNFELRGAHEPSDFRNYDAGKIRKEFLIERIFSRDEINMVCSAHDSLIIGGAMPAEKNLKLTAPDPLQTPYFLNARELGIINIGGEGIVKVGDNEYYLNNNEALYVGKGDHEIIFISKDSSVPAKFYFNSADADDFYPVKKITSTEAKRFTADSLEEANVQIITGYIVKETVQTCKLQMGMTELRPGCPWSTLPMQQNGSPSAYFYFNMPQNRAVSHFIGKTDDMRSVWINNEQAVISPQWSIHSEAGASNYDFIWGMAGE